MQSHQERALAPALAAAGVSPAIASDRVRSTLASLETVSHRLPAPAVARLAIPAPAPVPPLTAPAGAQNQLRYLHHRVAGVSNTNNLSREMLR
jgi:hypothetical protein